MTSPVRRTGSDAARNNGQPGKKLPVPCWMLLRRHTFDGDQEYTPGRKLKMMRKCSACGTKVKGGNIIT
jgi:hypothetical protein